MKKKNLISSILLAAVFAITAFLADTVLRTSVGFFLSPFFWLGLFVCIDLYLESSSRKNSIGSLSLLVISTAIIGFMAVFSPGFAPYVLVLCAVIWTSRALLIYSTSISISIDAAVQALCVISVLYSYYHTYSIPTVVWTFFLVQSLTSLIPANRNILKSKPVRGSSDPFMNAHSQAEDALQRLFAR